MRTATALTIVFATLLSMGCNNDSDASDTEVDDSPEAGIERECQAAHECAESDGKEFDFDACVQSNVQAVDDAESVGCGSEVHALLDCTTRNAECFEGSYASTGCDDEFDDYLDCLEG
jgi:uncharacterized lipoprotein NlpE involved in copper resistance